MNNVESHQQPRKLGVRTLHGTKLPVLIRPQPMNSLSDEEHALRAWASDQVQSRKDVSISTQRQRLKVAVVTIQAVLRFVHSSYRPPQAHRWSEDRAEDPITFETMCDPVKCNDGRTYDRWTVIDNRMTISPFTRRPFSIAVDDVDVRSWLFSTFPEQEGKFLSRRRGYRARALQHLRHHPREVQVVVDMLNNVLQWAPEDTQCRHELNVILGTIGRQSGQSSSLPQRSDSERSQTYVIPVITHEELIRERYGDGRPVALFFLLIYMGVYLLILAFSDLRD